MSALRMLTLQEYDEKLCKVEAENKRLNTIINNRAEDLEVLRKYEKLQEFARYVIRQELWGIDAHDTFEIQELAAKLGLIAPCIATEEDVDDEYDYFEVGDTIFKFSDMLEE